MGENPVWQSFLCGKKKRKRKRERRTPGRSILVSDAVSGTKIF